MKRINITVKSCYDCPYLHWSSVAEEDKCSHPDGDFLVFYEKVPKDEEGNSLIHPHCPLPGAIDLDKLEQKVKEALEKETKESLMEFFKAEGESENTSDTFAMGKGWVKNSISLPSFVSEWLCQNEFYFSYSLDEGKEICFLKKGKGDIEFSILHDRLFMNYGVYAEGNYFFDHIHAEWYRGQPYCLFEMYIPDTEDEFLRLIEVGLTKEYNGIIECLNPGAT